MSLGKEREKTINKNEREKNGRKSGGKVNAIDIEGEKRVGDNFREGETIYTSILKEEEN